MVRAHGLFDVFHPLLAHEVLVERQPATHRVVHGTRDTDAARLGQALQPGGHVHPLAVDVIPVLDHVAEIDADAKPDLALVGERLVAG